MIIKLEFTDSQKEIFKTMLDTTLRSLVYEEMQVKAALDDDTISTEELHNLNNYLASTSAQRVLVAEVLGTIIDNEEKRIIRP